MIYLLPALLFLTACGENGDGNSDTILTGFSGVLIFGIVVYIIFRYVRSR